VVLQAVDRIENVSIGNGEGEWHYDAEANALHIFFRGSGRNFCLNYQANTDRVCGPEVTESVYGMLHRAQIPYTTKTEVFEAVCRETDIPRKLGRLFTISMPETLRGAVLECILSDL